jgi:hypothetical protein
VSQLDIAAQRVDLWVKGIFIMSVLAVAGAGALFYHWYYEPDPLYVDYPTGDNHWSQCVERKFPLARMVKSSADLEITIKEYWWNIDGIDDSAGKLNEVPAGYTYYSLTAGTDQKFTFPKTVPVIIGVGRYRYRPQATYRVNPIKTIVRDLPVQYVNVVCDYDIARHGVMQ